MGAACCKQAKVNMILRRTDTGSTEVDEGTLGKENEMAINPAMYINKTFATLSDKYHRVNKIGSGAYGQVVLCRDKVTGLEKAVKIIRKTDALDINSDKLIDEVELLKSLDHPNIAKLYEFFEDSRKYYLVMDHYKGGELFDEIIRRQKFSEQDAAIIMKQILSGVLYLHTNKIVHRDLKPENLLLESDKPDALIKIVDFGLSAHFNGSRMMERLGTPYYIAPEVLKKCYDEKCDIWSCGVILYILLCGYPPFGGQTDEEILFKVERGKCVFDMNDWCKVSEEVRSLVKAMLTYDPSKRISAKEALCHPWFKKFSSSEVSVSSGALSNALTNMKKFQASQKLAGAALYFIANKLTTMEETNQLTRIFHELDTDGNGRLDRNELIQGYSKLMAEMGSSSDDIEKDVDEILSAVDLDNNGYMDYSEFVVACMDKSMLLSRERMQIAFNLFDSDNSGKISKAELAKIFGLSSIDDSIWNEILSTTDENNDGEVDFEEFEKMMHHICKIQTVSA